jgi:hypothetical protein
MTFSADGGTAVDFDNDGTADGLGYDTDNDGDIDLVGSDTDNDGDIDVVYNRHLRKY